LTKELQDQNSALWCLISCANIVGAKKLIEYSVEGLNIIGWEEIFGWEMRRDKFFEIGERIYNLTRLFNLREGFSRRDDQLPERLKEPREDTGWRIGQADFEKMLDEYYYLRGWNKEGKPSRETLERLHIKV